MSRLPRAVKFPQLPSDPLLGPVRGLSPARIHSTYSGVVALLTPASDVLGVDHIYPERRFVGPQSAVSGAQYWPSPKTTDWKS
ncbi:unnamed protein product [Rangifer tarandus platyrhynchus]|uniref:Uncharacterized protein n=1 Tax=Rangifer tarandus platyrhynchus TaxID=3082113 RepID=A0AC59Z7T1_RANTA